MMLRLSLGKGEGQEDSITVSELSACTQSSTSCEVGSWYDQHLGQPSGLIVQI